jgi:shikimate dehydrogenase
MIDRLAPSARSIASVNTIVNEDSRLIGYNTDYNAVRSLITRAGISPAKAFILRGSGGMAKAVAAALYDIGFRNARSWGATLPIRAPRES